MERVLPFLSLLWRRRFLETVGAAALAMASRPASAKAVAEPASMPNENVALTVNGRRHALDLDPRVTLLDALREHLGLTGTKKGCDQGQCGACTVIVNGQRINTCLTLAVMHTAMRSRPSRVLTQPALASAIFPRRRTSCWPGSKRWTLSRPENSKPVPPNEQQPFGFLRYRRQPHRRDTY